MAKNRALIIDDEPDILELLGITLMRMDIESDGATNLAEAKNLLGAKEYDICLTDMRLPDGDGIEIVRSIQKNHPNTPVAVITAHGSMDTAVAAMKAGAFDFLNKPIDLSALRKLVSAAINSSKLAATDIDNNTNIIGKSTAINSLKKSIQKLARSQAPVYVSGESGSGKELVARSIHEQGPRKDASFVPVNCGAIPKELMESEFFGHKKGSFTGATADKKGLFQVADGGTLFLDEVADLPLDMQVKLLRAIQEKAVRPIGAAEEIKIDVRILSATHKNLEKLVEEGDFRQDLFYRLNVIQLNVPPLRERGEDIALLAKYFLKKLALPDEAPATLSDTALNALKAYSFPGNIRELENVLERAYTLCEGEVIQEDDLKLSSNAPPVVSSSNSRSMDHYKMSQQYESIDSYLEEIEKEILCEVLEQARWNKTLAAKKLGISFRSFRYRLSKLGLGDESGE